MKKFGMVAVVAVAAMVFSGCAQDRSFYYRGWKHIEWHLLGAYKDLVELHKEIDRYIFNLDERDPDRY